MNFLQLPPTVDCPPEFCFCGRKTVGSHEFWFCSTECARLDSLRSLGDPNCHYRNVVRLAYDRAGAPEPQLRRMVSAVHLRPGPSERCAILSPPAPIILPMTLLHQSNAASTGRETRGPILPGFPTLSQVTGKILTKKASEGRQLIAANYDRPRWGGLPNASSRAYLAPVPDDAFKQISLDAIPVPEHAPPRTLRRVPSTIGSLRNNTSKCSVATLLNSGKSRRAKDPEPVFGHAVDPVVPPVRKESLPSHRQMSPSTAVPVQTSKALRRSVSFAGWNATVPRDRNANEQDSLMHMIEELREEISGVSDPRSLFGQEEDYN